MSTINLSALKSTTSNPPIMQSQNGIDRGKFCRGWVSFGRDLGDLDTYEIMSQFNVLSVVDQGVGTFRIQFKNAMPVDRYAVAGTASQSTGEVMGMNINQSNNLATPMTTTTFDIRTAVANVTNTDPNYVCVYAYADS